jgi:hypothetical protein
MKILNGVSSLFWRSLLLGHLFRIFDGACITFIIVIVYLFVLFAFLPIDDSNFIAVRLLYIFLQVIGINLRLISAWVYDGRHF